MVRHALKFVELNYKPVLNRTPKIMLQKTVFSTFQDQIAIFQHFPVLENATIKFRVFQDPYKPCMSLLTSDGLLPDQAGTGNDCIMHEPDRETNVNNQQAKITNHEDNSALESMDGEESTHTEEHKVKQENYRKSKRDNPNKLEQELLHSQNVLKSLKQHVERQTSQKSLQYRARACIKADSDFRKNINRLYLKLSKNLYKH